MLKQLSLITLILFVLCGVIFAQEKPEQEKMEKHEKHEKQEMHEKSDMHEMHHEEKMNNADVSESKEAWNKVCPVMGNPVDPEVPTVEYNGKAYGFCCPGCDDKFRNDPEKYSKNLSEDGKRFIGKKSK